MEKNKLFGTLKYFYSKKSIDRHTFNFLVEKLGEYKETDPLFYDYNMGKLTLAFDSSSDAICYLEDALKYDDKRASIYYHLYKAYVKNGEYKKALDSLCSFRLFDQNNCDCSLALSMLTCLIDMDADFSEYRNCEYLVSNSNKLFYVQLNNDKFSKMYERVIELYRERNYIDLVSQLQKMNDKTIEYNYPIEVESLLLIAKKLKEKQAQGYVSIHDILSLDSTVSLSEYTQMYRSLLLCKKISMEKAFKEAERVIESDLDKASALIDILSDCDRFNKYNIEIEYLKCRVEEVKKYNALSPDKKQIYDTARRTGHNRCSRDKFEPAENMYREAYEQTKHPVFEYYIGKTLYKQGKVEEGKKYLLRYAEHGGEKLVQCLLFLARIATEEKTDGLNKYIKRQHKIYNTFGFRRVLLINNTDKKRYGRCRNEDTDGAKTRASKTLHLTEKYFNTANLTVNPEDFYDCDVSGKLNIIKGLFINGNNTLGNFLLREIEKGCNPEDMGKVRQFQKNKKLYANQNRTN